MRNKILQSALIEFSNKPYAQASLNKIIERADISKGIIYHYFKNKDDLYLSIIEIFFDEWIEYVKNNYTYGSSSLDDNLHEYFKVRNSFFEKYPVYLGLFYNVINVAPNNLKADIVILRNKFDELNIEILTYLLDETKLNARFDLNTVIDFYRVYQSVIDINYMSNDNALDYEQRESIVKRLLDVFLYGIIERGD